jgi:phosphoglucosamine mutase
VLIVRDTRESGRCSRRRVAAGVSAAGGDALLGGVLPTPAAPLLIGRYGFDLASSLRLAQPLPDNGIKFFAGDGYKLSDETERERSSASSKPSPAGRRRRSGASASCAGARGLPARAAQRFAGLDLTASTCCSTAPTARPTRWRPRSSSASARGDRDRRRARRTQHQRRLRLDAHENARRAGGRARDTTIGFAFDGDGDRVLAVDRRGEVVDGDELIALARCTCATAAAHRQRRRRHGDDQLRLPRRDGARGSRGRDHANVGDRYVLEELRERGWTLGGEQSGHIIEMGFNRTGDGIASALLTLEALGGGDLSERHAMRKLPQRLVNVRVRDRDAIKHASGLTRPCRTPSGS